MALEPKIVRRSRILTKPGPRPASATSPPREPATAGPESVAPRRPILKLKIPPATPVEAPPAPTARSRPVRLEAPTLPDGPQWKCKPCGALVVLTGQEADDAIIRCSSCNARLGLAGNFKPDAPDAGKVRARRLS